MHTLHYWKIVVEICLFWYFFYMVLRFIKGTRTEQLIKGLAVIGIVILLTQQLGLGAVNWAITKIFPISVIALLIIFQPELRRGLTRLGQLGTRHEETQIIGAVAKAAVGLSKQRRGGIIAVERRVGLKTWIESGTILDSVISEELLMSIFTTQSSLHDGAVILQGNRVAAAGCILPLTQESNISKSLGTRHRAAIGLAEETDAFCVVVSEETGAISLAVEGKLTRDFDETRLVGAMKELLYGPELNRRISRFLSHAVPRTTDRGGA